MTSTYQFLPSDATSPPFQFLMTVAATQYVVQAFWSTYAQRWYFSIAAQGSASPALTMPMVGSDANETPINLVWSLFGAAAYFYYYPATQTIVTGP